MHIAKTFAYLFFILLISSCKSRFFRAPSGSMANTIKPGQTFFVQHTRDFKKNDIAVFDYFGNDYNSPAEEFGKYNQHWEKRVFRIIAWSGDTVEIKKGEVFINNRRIPAPELALANYEIRSKVYIDDLANIDQYGNAMQRSGDTFIYTVPLSMAEVRNYELRKPAVISVRRKSPEISLEDTFLTRLSKKDKWSPDNYGPLVIPSPGETIQIDSINFKLFKNIPGVQQGRYVLKEKLYFMLGDNRHGAEDSRYIGLIAHSKMYGIVKL